MMYQVCTYLYYLIGTGTLYQYSSKVVFEVLDASEYSSKIYEYPHLPTAARGKCVMGTWKQPTQDISTYGYIVIYWYGLPGWVIRLMYVLLFCVVLL